MSQSKRTGRPAGSSGNRQRQAILTAARELFATDGFRGTGMRAVAARAGVDVSLVAYYFTNKQGLFTATLELPETARIQILRAMTVPSVHRGRELARAYLGLWEAPETGEQLRLVTRTALSSQELGHRMEGVVADIIMGAVATGATPASHAVTEAAWGQLLGVAIARYLLQVHSLADLAFDDLVEMIGPGVQATLEREVSISPRQ